MHETVHAAAEAACDNGKETTHHYHHHAKEAVAEKEGFEMGDIAGLLALMQNNKGMDLPGMLALCKDKGVDGGFGGGGMFLFIFVLLFLFAGGGGMGLGGANRAAAAGLVGEGNCQQIIGIHDRISAAQAVSTNGFSTLNTSLCSSIAEVMAGVRNQGDRSVDATNSVSRQISECCCAVQQKLDTVLCAIQGVGSKIELSEMRTANHIEKLSAETALGFERLGCKIDNTAKDQELARLNREVCELRTQQTAVVTAQTAVSQLQGFLTTHYRPNTGCNTGCGCGNS